MTDEERFKKTPFPDPDFFNKLPDEFYNKFKRAVELTKYDSERGFTNLEKVAWYHIREVGLSTSTEITTLAYAVAHAVRNQDEPGEIVRSIETAYNHWKISNPQ